LELNPNNSTNYKTTTSKFSPQLRTIEKNTEKEINIELWRIIPKKTLDDKNE